MALLIPVHLPRSHLLLSAGQQYAAGYEEAYIITRNETRRSLHAGEGAQGGMAETIVLGSRFKCAIANCLTNPVRVGSS